MKQAELTELETKTVIDNLIRLTNNKLEALIRNSNYRNMTLDKVSFSIDSKNNVTIKHRTPVRIRTYRYIYEFLNNTIFLTIGRSTTMKEGEKVQAYYLEQAIKLAVKDIKQTHNTNKVVVK